MRSDFGTKLRAGCALAAVLLGAGLASCGGSRGGVASRTPLQAVGPFQVGVSNAPDPPRTGNDALTIVVRDAAGRPVRGARVDAIVSMEAMGAMPRMESRGAVKEVEAGVYRAGYGLAMNGEWDVAIRIVARDGSSAEAGYRVSTSTPGVAFANGTPAAGSSAAAGGVAAAPGAAASGGASDAAPDSGAALGVVRIDATRRQEIGVRTERLEVRDLTTAVRAVGRVAYDETRQSEVTLKFTGYVRDLRADFTGRPVRAGDVLFTAYSPELWSAQKEYLEALQGPGRSSGMSGGGPSDLAAAARQRLRLWDIPDAEIDRIARTGNPREALPIVAPVSGIITEKNVVKGSAFTAGQVLFKIVPLDPVWVMASVYQVDLPLLRVGMGATLTDPYLDERSRHGRVSFVAPSLEAETRTAQVRIEVPNPRGDLKPGMFVNVELEATLGRRLAVPHSAVLPTGERRIVFVDLGDGRLAPREVRLGARAGEYVEALAGLEPGDVVVTSGNFLVASESRLSAAARKW